MTKITYQAYINISRLGIFRKVLFFKKRIQIGFNIHAVKTAKVERKHFKKGL